MSDKELVLSVTWGEGESYYPAVAAVEDDNLWIYKEGSDPEDGDRLVNLDVCACADLVNFMIESGLIRIEVAGAQATALHKEL